MGDRCYIQIYIHRSDVDELYKVIDFFEESGDDKRGGPTRWADVVQFAESQVNYAAGDELGVLAAAGVPFIALNSPGDEYPSALRVSDGNQLLDIQTSGFDGPMIVLCDDQGEPLPAEVENAKLCARTVKKVEGGWERGERRWPKDSDSTSGSERCPPTDQEAHGGTATSSGPTNESFS